MERWDTFYCALCSAKSLLSAKRWARLAPGRNQKNVFRGERGLFSTDQKRGRGFQPPPNIWSRNGKLLPTRRKTPRNAAKCRKTPENARKCRKMLQNAGKCCKWLLNCLAIKRYKTPQNATTRHKMPQISQIGNKSLRDQIFGGAKNPTPFSGLLKLILYQNWGPRPPFPPENFFLVSSWELDKNQPTYCDESQTRAWAGPLCWELILTKEAAQCSGHDSA